AFAVTGLQQLTGFVLMMAWMALSRCTPYRYVPKKLTSRTDYLAVLLFSCAFTANIALNNYSMALIPISGARRADQTSSSTRGSSPTPSAPEEARDKRDPNVVSYENGATKHEPNKVNYDGGSTSPTTAATVNLIIRSCFPLPTFLAQKLVSWCTKDKAKDSSLVELGLMLLGVLCACIAVIAKMKSSGTLASESRNLVWGVTVCVISCFAGG
ncbi:unnamed protein product, partial [Prorocentrum cordatum]